MIDALALSAIARALDHGGDVDAACAELRRDDPLLRGPAKRRVRAAHADALIATHEKHADGGRHALRIAYLALAKAPATPEEVDDVGAVSAAYDAARALRPSKRHFWWATLLVLGAFAGGSIVTIRLLLRPGGPLAPIAVQIAERAAPPPAGAYASGGVPAPLPGDEVIRRVLSRDVPDYLIALDRFTERKRAGFAAPETAKLEAEMKGAFDLSVGTDARVAFGESAARALATLLTAARGAVEAPASESADEAVAEATGVLDDELAAAGAGYFVDGDVIHDTSNGKRLAIVYAFAVERVKLFATADTTVRALHLRRIDRLNWTHTLLGFTRPHLRAAALLLDQLDEQVLTLVAPGLAKDAPVRLFEPETAVPAEDRAAVEARAGELVRAEYGALLDAEAATKLGEALGKRRAILEAIEARAASRGYGIVTPAKLRLPEAFLKSIAPVAKESELAELRKVDEALASEENARAFTAVRDALAASVERHEVQHRLDARTPLPMPEALAARVGPLTQNGRERRHAATSRAELSAYLSELARDDRTGRVGLSMISRFLLDKRLHGSAECYAALVIFEGLGSALGVREEAPLVVSRNIDRRAVSRLYLALVAEPPAKLRDASKRLWEQLFGTKLVDLRAVPPKP